MHIADVRMMCILPFSHHRGNLRDEFLQVTIHACIAFRMMHINRIAKTADAHRYVRYVTIAYGEDGFALAAARLDVYSAVEMIRTRFAEVAGQRYFIVDW